MSRSVAERVIQSIENRCVDDDECSHWYATGHKEMNELYEQAKNKRVSSDARDRLDSVLDLVLMCQDCLQNSQLASVKTHVANILHSQVINQLKLVQEELARI